MDPLRESDQGNLTPFSSVPNRTRAHPELEELERREVPATLVGVTSANELVTFDSSSPEILRSTLPITGLFPSEDILAMDIRPSTGQVFGLGGTVIAGSPKRLYAIDTATGLATAVGGASFALLVPGTSFGFDFNPSTDQIRIVSDTGFTFRVDPNTGQVLDGNPQQPGTQPDTAFSTPGIVGIAYTNTGIGVGGTGLFGINYLTDQLVRLGNQNGETTPPLGQVTTVGSLGVNTWDTVGFDIGPDGVAFAALNVDNRPNSSVFQVNLATGFATQLGSMPGNRLLRGIAVTATTTGTGTGGTIQFGQPLYQVNEQAQVVLVTVVRLGGESQPATVLFNTSNGTAAGGIDYTPVSQSLQFQPGETLKSVSIPIRNDGVFEGAETFVVTLSSPTAPATLGSPSVAVVTIVDGTSIPVAGAANAVTSPNHKFVRSLYRDVLVREPEPGALTFWVGFLNATGNRTEVAMRLLLSQERFFLVTRNAFLFYGLVPDVTLLTEGVRQLQNGGPDSLKAFILGSPAYFQVNGGSGRGWLTSMFVDVLGRAPDPEGYAYYRNLVLGGVSRTGAAQIMLRGREADQRTVQLAFQTFLRRGPTFLGGNSFLEVLQRGIRDEQIFAGILGSNEYFLLAQRLV